MPIRPIPNLPTADRLYVEALVRAAQVSQSPGVGLGEALLVAAFNLIPRLSRAAGQNRAYIQTEIARLDQISEIAYGTSVCDVAEKLHQCGSHEDSIDVALPALAQLRYIGRMDGLNGWLSLPNSRIADARSPRIELAFQHLSALSPGSGREGFSSSGIGRGFYSYWEGVAHALVRESLATIDSARLAADDRAVAAAVAVMDADDFKRYAARQKDEAASYIQAWLTTRDKELTPNALSALHRAFSVTAIAADHHAIATANQRKLSCERVLNAEIIEAIQSGVLTARKISAVELRRYRNALNLLTHYASSEMPQGADIASDRTQSVRPRRT